MSTFSLNIPISKVDEEQRIVYGYATVEELDRQGDIVDYEASKTAFSAWAGNIREQHDPKRVIGKKVSMEFDDAKKGVLVGAYVSKSPDGVNAWTKVQEGLFTGFSIGGKIKSIVKETLSKEDGSSVEANRIVDYDLSELSLVDVPACPSAQLVMVKSLDGQAVEVEELHQTTDGQPLPWFMKSFAYSIGQVNQNPDSRDTESMTKDSKENAMSKDAIEKVNVHAGEERDANAEVVEQATEAKTVEKVNVHAGEERDVEAKPVAEDAPAPVEEKPAVKEEPAVAESVEVVEPEKTVTPELTKGLYTVANLGDLIQQLCYVTEDSEWEAQYEGDASTVPGQLRDAIKTLAGIYKQMAVEEATEIAGSDDTEVATASVELADTSTDLIKMVDTKLAANNDDLVKAITASISTTVAEQLKPLEERLNKVESQPTNVRPQASYHVVAKAEEPKSNYEDLLTKADAMAADPNVSNSDRTALMIELRKAARAQ